MFLDRGNGTAYRWNTHLIAVRSFLSFRSARGWIDHYPLALVNRRPPRDRTSKAVPVSALETRVELTGLEPVASCMPCKRSSKLSYSPQLLGVYIKPA